MRDGLKEEGKEYIVIEYCRVRSRSSYKLQINCKFFKKTTKL